jgi:hypothetical protein
MLQQHFVKDKAQARFLVRSIADANLALAGAGEAASGFAVAGEECGVTSGADWTATLSFWDCSGPACAIEPDGHAMEKIAATIQ